MLQRNCRGSLLAVDSLLCPHFKWDIACLQDPPSLIKNKRNYHGLTCVFPDSPSADICTCILLKKNLPFRSIASSCGRVTCVLLEGPLHSVLIASSYIQHSTRNGETDLFSIIQKANLKSWSIVICGDLNAHHSSWGGSTTDKQGERLFNFFQEHNLNILNDPLCTPTYYGDQGSFSWIDVSIASPGLLISSWEVTSIDAGLSDHALISFMLRLPQSRLPKTRKPCWKKVHWLSFSSDLDKHLSRIDALSDTSWVISMSDLSSLTKSLENCIQTTANKHVPHRLINNENRAWWNDQLSQERSGVRRLGNRLNRKQRVGTATPEDVNQFRAAKKEYRKKIIQAKRDLWRRLITDTTDKDIWQTVKRFCRPSTTLNLHYITGDDNALYDNEDQVLSALGDKFFFPDDLHVTAEHTNLIAEVNLNLSFPPFLAGTDFAPISPEEVLHIIKNLPPYKSPGPDKIPGIVYKKCFPTLLPIIIFIFTKCFELGDVPDHWKHCTVVPVPKSNCARSQLSNMRPIALINVISKILDKLVSDRLTLWFESIGGLSSCQHGFRSSFSTSSALTRITHYIDSHRKNSEVVGMLSIDLAGAFDRCWGPAIVNILQSKLVPAYLVTWISNFLKNRFASIPVLSQSRTFHVPRGTPQGSPLSPLLFSVLMESLIQALNEVDDLECVVFADDVTLLSSGSADSVQTSLNRALEIAHSWCRSTRMEISVKKTRFITFPSSPRAHIPALSLSLNSYNILPVESLKVLGLTFDPYLRFSDHLSVILSKCKKRMHLLKRLAGLHWGHPPETLIMLFKSTILPSLFYACSAWGPFVTTSSLKAWKQWTRLALIYAMGLHKTCSYSTVHQLSGLPPLDIQLEGRIRKELLNLHSQDHLNWICSSGNSKN